MMTKKRQRIRFSIIVISFFLFPAIFYYMSPYIIIDGSMHGIISGSFLLFILQFVSALFLGRAFCGWVCPAGGAQEIVMKASKKRVNKLNLIKWLIWIPWIGFIVFIAVKNGGYSSIQPAYQTVFGFSMGNVFALFVYLIVLSLIIIPSFVIGRRSFCHHICWMAPFMIIGRKIRNLLNIPALQLNANPGDCTQCHTCTTNCPMSLPVENMVKQKKMEHHECILCLTCVDGCTGQALHAEFKSRKS
jgi:ferredoxin-type protein NapH